MLEDFEKEPFTMVRQPYSSSEIGVSASLPEIPINQLKKMKKIGVIRPVPIIEIAEALRNDFEKMILLEKRERTVKNTIYLKKITNVTIIICPLALWRLKNSEPKYIPKKTLR